MSIYAPQIRGRIPARRNRVLVVKVFRTLKNRLFNLRWSRYWTILFGTVRHWTSSFWTSNFFWPDNFFLIRKKTRLCQNWTEGTRFGPDFELSLAHWICQCCGRVWCEHFQATVKCRVIDRRLHQKISRKAPHWIQCEYFFLIISVVRFPIFCICVRICSIGCRTKIMLSYRRNLLFQKGRLPFWKLTKWKRYVQFLIPILMGVLL